MNWEKIVSVMTEAVYSASEVIKDGLFRNGNIVFEHKLTHDYVTETDKKSEEIITAILKQAYPDDVIIGEESFDDEELPEGSFWVVDPLDGTTNFIHGFPMVSVTVARIEQGAPVAGCVYNPVTDELFIGVRRGGVYLNGKQIIKSNSVPDVAHSLVATGFPFRRKDLIRPYLKTFEEIFRQVSDIRRTGSAALDLAYLAAGRIDGFWEVGLKPWDIAAGILMIEELGGVVSDFWGSKGVLKNGNIIATSSQVLYEVIYNAVRSNLLPHMR